MPQYGAKNLQWAPFAASNPEPEDALPNYGTPMKLGDLMSVAETLNFSEVESRADDVRKIYLREFVDGSLAVGVLELPNETASAVTGAQIDSTEGAKDIHFSSNDTSPYGCLGFYTTNIKADGSKYYKGLFYPKVKASLDGRTYNTKQKTIVLDSPKLTFSVDACKAQHPAAPFLKSEANMKVHEVDLCGQHLYLCLNGQALFDLYDKFGTKGFITDPLKDSDKKSFEAVCYYLFKLSEQGELYRRWQGQTHGPVLTEQFFRVNLAPREVAAAKDAILAAIVLGFRREEKETGDLDLGLVELQKKTGSP